ncbi:MAG TPA: efflux RND transporter permease subunit [Gemmataceae bacterium]|nr:efflux RND transporter permease subunit [Gemmataceae bacterium]
MWLIKASLRNPYMVATIVFMILFLGLLSLGAFGGGIPIDILPVFKSPAVQIITYYQGMPASSIEKTITNRIERWCNQSQGAQRVVSKSVPGVSIVRIYFRDDTDPNLALTMTGQLALGTLPTMPPNTLPPVVLPFDPTATMPLGVLTVSNPGMNEADVKDIGRIWVRNALGSVPGCVAPVAIGGKDRTILVYLKPNEMEARHLSAMDVVMAIRKGNQMVTPGIAYFGDNQLLLDSNMMADKIKELMDLPIRMEPGNNVFLKDIGSIEDSATIQTSRVRIASESSHWEGHNQVYVPVYRQQGASSLAVANGVKNALKSIEEICPPGTKLSFVMDQTIFVREAIHSLIQEGIIGAVLVSIMILLFLGNWRMTLIASMSIPLALLGAITCLYITGNTINAMTLGGLALAIGPLVDDAIVELENNHRNYSLGKSRVRAALDGCAEVMVPVLVATLTTNIVLAPVALQKGMGGFLFRPLALSVTFAMFSSFLLSRTFVPMMCAKFLPDEHRGHAVATPTNGHGAAQGGHDHGHGHGGPPPTSLFGRIHHRIELFLDNATQSYEVNLHRVMRHRFKLLGFTVLLIVLAGFLAPRVGREFFPQVDAGQITVYLRCPSNMRLDATTRRVAAFEEFVKEVIPVKEREMIVSEVGLDPDWSAAYTANSGQQDAVVRIQLSEARTKSSQQYAEELRRRFDEQKHFADLRISFDTGGMVSTALNNGASSPIDIQVTGGSRDQGLALATQIRNRVAGVNGVVDARVLQRLDAPYLVINVNREKAATAGLSPTEVIQQAVAAMNSSISIDRNFWIDVKSGNQYFVAVQYPENPSMTLDDLLNVEAKGPNQKYPVKLSSLAQFRRRTGAVEINHDSLQRVYNIQMNLEGRDIGHVAKEVQTSLKSLPVPPGLRWIKEGHQHKLVKDKSAPLDAAKSSREPHGVTLAEGMSWTMRGEYERMNESFYNLGMGLAGAVVLVYLLQVALFRSWLGPLVIMCTVPLGLIGVVFMLYLTGTTLNVQSEMGAIFLVGIEVNTGVLMADFANTQRKLGMSAKDAIIKAATIRFRPILMTFLACFIDLIPMAIGLERGSEANVPLARAVIGGLLCSTALSRFVLPVLYSLLIQDGDDSAADIEAELADEPPVPALAVAVGPSAARAAAPVHDGISPHEGDRGIHGGCELGV